MEQHAAVVMWHEHDFRVNQGYVAAANVLLRAQRFQLVALDVELQNIRGGHLLLQMPSRVTVGTIIVLTFTPFAANIGVRTLGAGRQLVLACLLR